MLMFEKHTGLEPITLLKHLRVYYTDLSNKSQPTKKPTEFPE